VLQLDQGTRVPRSLLHWVTQWAKQPLILCPVPTKKLLKGQSVGPWNSHWRIVLWLKTSVYLEVSPDEADGAWGLLFLSWMNRHTFHSVQLEKGGRVKGDTRHKVLMARVGKNCQGGLDIFKRDKQNTFWVDAGTPPKLSSVPQPPSLTHHASRCPGKPEGILHLRAGYATRRKAFLCGLQTYWDHDLRESSDYKRLEHPRWKSVSAF
jgi:hypothetical protein